KLALERMDVDSDLLVLVKDKELEHLIFDNRWIGSIVRPQMDRKQGFISIIAKAIFDEIISIDINTIKESFK
ncbi:MAG: hypothetical protein ACW981_17590, partial [Candidatus Hodarchaeales archaeon]